MIKLDKEPFTRYAADAGNETARRHEKMYQGRKTNIEKRHEKRMFRARLNAAPPYETPIQVAKRLCGTVIAPHLDLRDLGQVDLPMGNAFWAYMAHCGSGTRVNMPKYLERILAYLEVAEKPEHFPWHTLSYQHVWVIRAWVEQRYGTGTYAAAHMTHLRGVLKQAYLLDKLPADEWEKIRQLKSIKVQDSRELPPAGREITKEEIRQLLEGQRPGLAGMRTRVAIALMYGGGLRSHELAQAEARDYDGKTGQLIIRRGKGGKMREVYLRGVAKEMVDQWLALRHDPTFGPLLCHLSTPRWPSWKNGVPVPSEPVLEDWKPCLSADRVRGLLEAAYKAAGVEHVQSHDYRRSNITHLLDAGIDISVVQKLAGHASPTMTARYDRRGPASRMKAAEALAM